MYIIYNRQNQTACKMTTEKHREFMRVNKNYDIISDYLEECPDSFAWSSELANCNGIHAYVFLDNISSANVRKVMSELKNSRDVVRATAFKVNKWVESPFDNDGNIIPELQEKGVVKNGNNDRPIQ